jgi:hypothetical protein
MYENEPEIIVVTETFFDSTIDNREFAVPRYVSFRKDCKLHFYTEGTYQMEARGEYSSW